MKNVQLRTTLLVAALAVAFPAGAQTLEVKIGHVGPLTGGIAHLGKDNENGARLAIEEANAAKIKIGGKEVRFSLVAEDDQADPKVGTTVAQKLVDVALKHAMAEKRRVVPACSYVAAFIARRPEYRGLVS